MTTQFANASYQEVIDLHTESDRVSIVGIHTPCSDTPYHMLKGFWDQFRKFKYNGCSMSLVPAAQLPVDPLQVSYDASEPAIDPRDMLNPIMFHGCHGNDMGAILNGLYSDPVAQDNHQLIESDCSDSVDVNEIRSGVTYLPPAEVFESLYYKALTDNTWLKAHPQRGFRKNGLHPMIYQVASTVQYANLENSVAVPTGITHDDSDGTITRNATTGNMGVGATSSTGTIVAAPGFGRPTINVGNNQMTITNPVTRTMNSFLTPRLMRLGWMDTRQVVGIPNNGAVSEVTSMVSESRTQDEMMTELYRKSADALMPVLTPKIFMGMLMLPPAYKTEQHFRLVLNHSFSFAKFRGASMQYPNFGMIHDAYAYHNFSTEDESKRRPQPEPEPEPKEDVKNES